MTGQATTQGRFHQSTGGDIENNHSNNNNRFNGSSFSEGIKENGHRLSQRITNFIENKNSGNLRFGNNSTLVNDSSTLYEPTSKELMNSNNGSFLRPMSPVEVDYPTINNDQRSFTPTNHFAAISPSVEKKNLFSSSNRNVSIDDPYSNHSVNFTMIEPTNSKKFNNPQQQSTITGRDSYETSYRSASPRQDYPMQTMSSAAISHHDDFKFDPPTDDNTFDYLQTPTKAKTNNMNNYF